MRRHHGRRWRCPEHTGHEGQRSGEDGDDSDPGEQRSPSCAVGDHRTGHPTWSEARESKPATPGLMEADIATRRVDEGTRGHAGVPERLGEPLESPAIEHLPRVLVPVEVDDCSRVQVHAAALAVQFEVAEPIEAAQALPGAASDRQEHHGLPGLKPPGPSELRPHCVSTRAEVPHEGRDDLIRRHRIRFGPTEAASRRMSSIELHRPGPMTLDGGTTS